jgi:hypothetical protein
VPLARTHIVMVSARAVAARAVEAMSAAASAAQSVLVVMAFSQLAYAQFSRFPSERVSPTPASKDRRRQSGKSFSHNL